jgi:hypothetical protein
MIELDMKSKLNVFANLIFVICFIGLIISCEKDDGPVQSQDEIMFKKTIGSWIYKQEKITFYADSTFIDSVIPEDSTIRHLYYVFQGKFKIEDDTMRWYQIEFVYTGMENTIRPGRFHKFVIPEFKIRKNGDTLGLSSIRKFYTDNDLKLNDFLIEGTWYEICPAIVFVYGLYSNGTCKNSFTFKPNYTYCWESVFTTDTIYKFYSTEDKPFSFENPNLFLGNEVKVLVTLNGNEMKWDYMEREFIRQ